MTGFGAATVEDQSLSVRVEVKSLNSKVLDLNVRLPRSLQDKEFCFYKRFRRIRTYCVLFYAIGCRIVVFVYIYRGRFIIITTIIVT